MRDKCHRYLEVSDVTDICKGRILQETDLEESTFEKEFNLKGIAHNTIKKVTKHRNLNI
jgi:hypothetical protein